jgi:hypothetical protein
MAKKAQNSRKGQKCLKKQEMVEPPEIEKKAKRPKR